MPALQEHYRENSAPWFCPDVQLLELLTKCKAFLKIQVVVPQLNQMRRSWQTHCFSTLNHNLDFCYNDIRFLSGFSTNWPSVSRGKW